MYFTFPGLRLDEDGEHCCTTPCGYPRQDGGLSGCQLAATEHRSEALGNIPYGCKGMRCVDLHDEVRGLHSLKR